MIEAVQSLEGNISSIGELNGTINVGVEKIPPVTQEKTATPTTELQEIIPDENYNGLSKVTVNAVDSSVDSNIVPENIKNGVEILGVTGNASVADFEITDCYRLFERNHRLDLLNKLLPLCKNVTDCSYMFYWGHNLTTVDLSGFDTSKVTKMDYMFAYCYGLLELDVSNFDTSKVTTMEEMFRRLDKVTELDVSNFDTSKVTRMDYMFGNCIGITKIDLSNFDTSSLKSDGYMFIYCSKLSTIIIDNENLFPMTGDWFAYGGTPIAKGTGYIYVPDNMVETYKQSTNWSKWADQIKGMSELPTEE